eukprot:TRINITY_DN15437_c0_g1_i1.p1 TRINITY_DN15437_c0_g1~~TRINITY_DN15437_c0_g1_i1.p1  ORF type:complete len:133 (+),score=12.93 TRINITY_DN15437_c0_g1_i1:59-400(+)
MLPLSSSTMPMRLWFASCVAMRVDFCVSGELLNIAAVSGAIARMNASVPSVHAGAAQMPLQDHRGHTGFHGEFSGKFGGIFDGDFAGDFDGDFNGVMDDGVIGARTSLRSSGN